MPVKRSQKADQSVQNVEHVDSKAIATPGTAKRGRPRKVVRETLDQEESTPPPVPVIPKASTKKKRTAANGSNDSTTKVRGTRKAVAVVQNSGDDDEEKDKENTVSGDVEDWEQQTQAQGVAVKVRVSRSRGAAGGERVEGTTTGKTKTGRATRSASKAVKVEVVEEAVVEPARMRTRAKSRTG